MSETNRKNVIISPHPDDEIIGCFEILTQKNNPPIIVYTGTFSKDRTLECSKLKTKVNISVQVFLKSIPPDILNERFTFYFPDPIYETHFEHRSIGMEGEKLARSGLDVIFYNTNMQAPYIHTVDNPEKKKEFLDDVYPSQSDLWKYEHKYFLFEGYNKWIF